MTNVYPKRRGELILRAFYPKMVILVILVLLGSNALAQDAEPDAKQARAIEIIASARKSAGIDNQRDNGSISLTYTFTTSFGSGDTEINVNQNCVTKETVKSSLYNEIVQIWEHDEYSTYFVDTANSVRRVVNAEESATRENALRDRLGMKVDLEREESIDRAQSLELLIWKFMFPFALKTCSIPVRFEFIGRGKGAIGEVYRVDARTERGLVTELYFDTSDFRLLMLKQTTETKTKMSKESIFFGEFKIIDGIRVPTEIKAEFQNFNGGKKTSNAGYTLYTVKKLQIDPKLTDKDFEP